MRNLLSGLGPVLSPSNYCNCRRSCEGVQSPSSSAVNSWQRQHCSEAAGRTECHRVCLLVVEEEVPDVHGEVSPSTFLWTSISHMYGICDLANSYYSATTGVVLASWLNN